MIDLNKYGRKDNIIPGVAVYRIKDGYNVSYLNEIKEYLTKEPLELNDNFYIYPGDLVKRWGKEKSKIRTLEYIEPMKYLGYIQGKNHKHLFLTCDNIYCSEIIFIGKDTLVNIMDGYGVIDIRNLSKSEITREIEKIK
ncbi:MAG: hypothetical protein RSB33_05935 [Cetobacterium sp.]